jgi:4-amino-4-deoxy-L-arabinose transferase-like glycosyltransferase
MRSTTEVQMRDVLLIGALALLSFLPFLSASPLFDWDEINFAESAREMIASGNYFQVQINFEPFWEKPPLFIWLQVISMKLFGVNAFAARLPNALAGVCTLLSLYLHGARMRTRRFGLIVAGFYFISLLPFMYFKSGIIDPLFNFMIFLGLMQILRFEMAENGQRPVAAPYLAGLWIGLATLTKGPVAVLVTVLVYFIWKLIWDRKRIPWLALVQFLAVYLAVILSWFGSLILFSPDGLEIVTKFIIYQAELFSQVVAGHEQPFFYHFLVFLLGCFPLSAFAFRGMALKGLQPSDKLLRNLMLVWFWVILILFSIVRTKIVHYSSMLYFPGAFLAALYLDRLWEEGRRPRWDTWAIYGLGALVFGALTVGVNVIVLQQDWLQSQATNPFMQACLGVDVHWTGWEFLPGLLFVIAAALGVYFLRKADYKAFFLNFVVATPLFLNGLNLLVLPRIADFSQNAAISFFQQKAQEECYIMVQGYKSYAHYFYGEVEQFEVPFAPYKDREDWLANGPIDKKVYMVMRIDRATAEMEGWFGRFTRIGERNGFRFYERLVPTTPLP